MNYLRFILCLFALFLIGIVFDGWSDTWKELRKVWEERDEYLESITKHRAKK